MIREWAVAYFLMESLQSLDMKKLSGKIVVVTGASSGAGRAMANALASEGAKLVLAARREEVLKEVAQECRELGGEALVVVTDVKEMADVHRLAKAALARYYGIDAWVNNAGVLAAGLVDEIPADVNEDVIRTNLLGYIHGAQAALPVFKQQGYGLLINNISVGGWLATPYMAAYSAAKFGLRGFFESLKGELKPFPNIHVCNLYPGFLDTPGMQHAANYTGKNLRPAPPVYDARRVADAVVNAVKNPTGSKYIGSSSVLLKTAYGLFPSLTRNMTAAIIRSYLRKAEDIETTSGNILGPVPFGTGIDGGWQEYFEAPVKKRPFFLAAGLALVVYAAVKLTKPNS